MHGQDNRRNEAMFQPHLDKRDRRDCNRVRVLVCTHTRHMVSRWISIHIQGGNFQEGVAEADLSGKLRKVHCPEQLGHTLLHQWSSTQNELWRVMSAMTLQECITHSTQKRFLLGNISTGTRVRGVSFRAKTLGKQ